MQMRRTISDMLWDPATWLVETVVYEVPDATVLSSLRLRLRELISNWDEADR